MVYIALGWQLQQKVFNRGLIFSLGLNGENCLLACSIVDPDSYSIVYRYL